MPSPGRKRWAVRMLPGSKADEVALHDDWQVCARMYRIERETNQRTLSRGLSLPAPDKKRLKIMRAQDKDHARRKFKDAQDAQPRKKKGSPPSKADMALLIGKLYRIEREIKESRGEIPAATSA